MSRFGPRSWVRLKEVRGYRTGGGAEEAECFCLHRAGYCWSRCMVDELAHTRYEVEVKDAVTALI